MGDLSFIAEGTAKVSIEHRVRTLRGDFHVNGIWLIAEWSNCRLVAEIGDKDKDCDAVTFHYYSGIEQDAPVASFYIQGQDFNGEAIRFITRAVMKASRGQLELSDLKNSSLYSGTGVQVSQYLPKEQTANLSTLSTNH